MTECKTYGVLVRDNTIKNIEASEDVRKVTFHSASNEIELNKLMVAKLNSAVKSLSDNVNKTGKFNIDDIVNVQEILDKIKHEAPYDKADYMIAQEKKAVHNGRYDLNIVLDYMERKL